MAKWSSINLLRNASDTWVGNFTITYALSETHIEYNATIAYPAGRVVTAIQVGNQWVSFGAGDKPYCVFAADRIYVYGITPSTVGSTIVVRMITAPIDRLYYKDVPPNPWFYWVKRKGSWYGRAKEATWSYSISASVIPLTVGAGEELQVKVDGQEPRKGLFAVDIIRAVQGGAISSYVISGAVSSLAHSNGTTLGIEFSNAAGDVWSTLAIGAEADQVITRTVTLIQPTEVIGEEALETIPMAQVIEHLGFAFDGWETYEAVALYANKSNVVASSDDGSNTLIITYVIRPIDSGGGGGGTSGVGGGAIYASEYGTSGYVLGVHPGDGYKAFVRSGSGSAWTEIALPVDGSLVTVPYPVGGTGSLVVTTQDLSGTTGAPVPSMIGKYVPALARPVTSVSTVLPGANGTAQTIVYMTLAAFNAMPAAQISTDVLYVITDGS